eukprot:365673-Chlamydomonas_euryale.AAC.13
MGVLRPHSTDRAAAAAAETELHGALPQLSRDRAAAAVVQRSTRCTAVTAPENPRREQGFKGCGTVRGVARHRRRGRRRRCAWMSARCMTTKSHGLHIVAETSGACEQCPLRNGRPPAAAIAAGAAATVAAGSAGGPVRFPRQQRLCRLSPLLRLRVDQHLPGRCCTRWKCAAGPQAAHRPGARNRGGAAVRGLRPPKGQRAGPAARPRPAAVAALGVDRAGGVGPAAVHPAVH